VLPDRGERYLDTIYSDDWVRAHLGAPFPTWTDAPGGEPAEVDLPARGWEGDCPLEARYGE
jgi:hypothetical protein